MAAKKKKTARVMVADEVMPDEVGLAAKPMAQIARVVEVMGMPLSPAARLVLLMFVTEPDRKSLTTAELKRDHQFLAHEVMDSMQEIYNSLYVPSMKMSLVAEIGLEMDHGNRRTLQEIRRV